MTRGARARLFVAIDPPRKVREELLSWARGALTRLHSQRARNGAADVRVLEPEALHVTLCFLGSRPVEEIDAIGAVLERCAAHVGELSLGAPLWLPPRRPRALAVELHDAEGGLARLQGSLREALVQATDWEAERRRFRAHITVARLRGRGGGRRSTPADPLALPATPPLRFVPESVVLYRSWLSPAGASYEALACTDLLAAGL